MAVQVTARPTILDHRGAPMRTALAAQAFRGGEVSSQAMASWSAFLSDPDSAYRGHTRDTVVARARDLYRNTPVARSSVDGDVARHVGAGWRLRSKPDHRALGISFEEATALGEAIETNFRLWANDAQRRCHAGRRLSWGKMQRLMRRQRRIDGENLAVLRWIDDGGPFATAVQLINTDRLCNENRAQDGPNKRQGIHFNTAGAPIAYDFLNAHPHDPYAGRDAHTWVTVPRATPDGRPVVIHGFTDEEVGQSRGVSPFAPVLQIFRVTDKYIDSETASAVLGASIGAFIKSGFSPAEVAESLGSPQDVAAQGKGWQDIRMEHYGETPVYFGDVRIPVLPPGDEIELTNASRDTGPYAEFVKTAYQMIAAALGQTYPELAQNWDGLTYSTLRGAYNLLWERVAVDRAEFCDDTIFPIFYAVTDEGFDRGYIETPPGAPEFWDMPEAYLAGDWIGPAQKHIDPVKGVQASEAAVDADLSTLENEAAGQGQDWREIIDQRAREQDYRRARGLPPKEGAASAHLVAPSDLETAPASPTPNPNA